MIDVGLGRVSPLAKHRQQGLHPLDQDLVIVAAESVRGDPASRALALPLALKGGGKSWRRMGVGKRDHAAGVGQRPSRIRARMSAHRTPPGESIHQALRRARGGGRFGFDKWLRTRHANGAKTERPGPILERLRQ